MLADMQSTGVKFQTPIPYRTQLIIQLQMYLSFGSQIVSINVYEKYKFTIRRETQIKA
jgi:hypothetical protein